MTTRPLRPGDAAPSTLVWDAPLRMFHWLLAASFALAWITAESDRWQLLHVTAGCTVAGLVVFRLGWGFVGPRHARFSDFVRGPRAVLRYLRSLVQGRPERHAGHNPAGALAILALLGLALLTTASGLALHQGLGEWLEDPHEALAHAMLAIVAVHVAAVLASSCLHRDNLVAAMVHGRRKGVPPQEGIRRPLRPLAVALLAAAAVFWTLQWQAAPAGGLLPASAAHRSHHDDGDDD